MIENGGSGENSKEHGESVDLIFEVSEWHRTDLEQVLTSEFHAFSLFHLFHDFEGFETLILG